MHEEEIMSREQTGDITPEENEMPAPTHDEVEQWTKELKEIEAQMAMLIERKTLLQQVLETMPAVEKLRGNAPLVSERPEQAPESVQNVEEGLKLVQAIPMVLARFRRPMTPAQIKKHLADVGFTRPYGETYFYTAVKRATEKNAITKERDGRYKCAEQFLNLMNGREAF